MKVLTLLSILIFCLNSEATFTVGNDSASCTGANSGSIRYNTSSNVIEVCKSSSWGNVSESSTVPSNMMIYVTGACPSGWTEYTTARGRYMVGLPSGGTLAGTSGTALSNSEDRATGRHLHAVDPPSVTTSGGGAHGHTSYSDSTNVGTQMLGYRTNGAAGIGSSYTNYASHVHSINIPSTNTSYHGSDTGTNAPYRQLRACSKT